MRTLKFLTIGFLFVGMVCLMSCKKDNPSPNSSGSSTQTYELRFTCTSSNPYLIEVNGNSDIVQGNSFKVYILDKGTYSWEVTQQSGYLLYPTVLDGTANLDQDKEIVFP